MKQTPPVVLAALTVVAAATLAPGPVSAAPAERAAQPYIVVLDDC